MLTTVLHPTVLIAVPFLALILVMGARGMGTLVAAGLAGLIVFSGWNGGDSVWWMERGWAVLVGGCFVAETLRRPGTQFTSRALLAVGGAVAVAAALLAWGPHAWPAVDWAVRQRMMEGVGMALDAITLVRGGQAFSSVTVAAIYQTVEAQVQVFPAMVAISSMSALGVAWWFYRRLTAADGEALGPLRDFRFNDHLVWVFIGGILLMIVRWGDAFARVGANAVVFMGALYALRGAAVIVFLSGGLSLVGYILVALGLVFMSPLILAGAMVIGLGDTWFDVRTRIRDLAA